MPSFFLIYHFGPNFPAAALGGQLAFDNLAFTVGENESGQNESRKFKAGQYLAG